MTRKTITIGIAGAVIGIIVAWAVLDAIWRGYLASRGW